MRSGATRWAGRAKKPLGRAEMSWRGVVTMGVASGWFLRLPADTSVRMGEDGVLYTTPLQAISEEQLKVATDADAVVAIVRAAASVFSAEELINSQAEISEESLEGVTGGIFSAGMNCTGNLAGGLSPADSTTDSLTASKAALLFQDYTSGWVGSMPWL